MAEGVNINSKHDKKNNTSFYVRFLVDGKERVLNLSTENIFCKIDNNEIALSELDAKDLFKAIKDKDKLYVKQNGKEFKLLDISNEVLRAEQNASADKYLSLQTPLKIGKEYLIKSHNFKLDSKGEYVLVRLKNYNTPVLRNIKSLYKKVRNEETGAFYNVPLYKNGKIDLSDYTTQNLYFKDGETEYATEQLTKSELLNTYKEMTIMAKTNNEQDVLSADSYLRLKSGEYVKETHVRPIAYDYATEKDVEHPDAYLVTAGEKQYIVKNLGRVTINGAQYDFKNAKNVTPLKKSQKRLKDCDVIQTTNESKDASFYECEVLNGVEDNEKQERLKRANDKFQDLYKQNKYMVDSVFVKDENGNLVKKDLQDNSRYKLTNDFVLDDASAKGRDANYLIKNQMYFEDGKFKGAPKFSIWKYFNNHVGISLEVMLYSFSAAMMGSLFGPVIPIIGLTIAAGAIPVTLLAGAIEKIKVQGWGYHYKDKIAKNRKEWAKDLKYNITRANEKYNTKFSKLSAYEELSGLISRMEQFEGIATPKDSLDNMFLSDSKKLLKKYCPKYKKKSLTDIKKILEKKRDELNVNYDSLTAETSMDKFEDEFSRLERDMASLSTTIYDSKFELKKKKGAVNTGNIVLVEEYRRRLKRTEKEYRLAQATATKTGKQEDIEKAKQLKEKLEEMKTNYTVTSSKAPHSKEFDQLQTRMETLKGFMREKLYGEHKEELKDYTYDFNTGKFLYKGKVIKEDEVVKTFTIEKKNGETVVKTKIVKRKSTKTIKHAKDTKRFNIYGKVKDFQDRGMEESPRNEIEDEETAEIVPQPANVNENEEVVAEKGKNLKSNTSRNITFWKKFDEMAAARRLKNGFATRLTDGLVKEILGERSFGKNIVKDMKEQYGKMTKEQKRKFVNSVNSAYDLYQERIENEVDILSPQDVEDMVKDLFEAQKTDDGLNDEMSDLGFMLKEYTASKDENLEEIDMKADDLSPAKMMEMYNQLTSKQKQTFNQEILKVYNDFKLKEKAKELV